MEQAEEEDFGTSTLGQVEINFVHPWTGGDYFCSPLDWWRSFFCSALDWWRLFLFGLGLVEIIFVWHWTGGDYIFNIIFSVTTTT